MNTGAVFGVINEDADKTEKKREINNVSRSAFFFGRKEGKHHVMSRGKRKRSEEDRVIEVSVRVRRVRLRDVLVGEKHSLISAQNNRERKGRRVVKAESGRRGREK